MNRNPKTFCDELQEDHYKAMIETNNVYKNLLYKEFANFKNYKNKIRSTLIKQNIGFRECIKDINYSKNSTMKNGNLCSKTNQQNLNINNTVNGYDLEDKKIEILKLNLKNNFEMDLDKNDFINIPKGIFYYPIERVLRADDIYIVNFIPHFSNFEKFQNVIEKTYYYLNEWFDEIPHNLDFDEKINNPEFIIWIFIEGLKILSKQVEEFTQLFFVNILTIFSSIIEKNSSTVFKIFQIFLRKIINEKRIKKSLDVSKIVNPDINSINNQSFKKQLNENNDISKTKDDLDNQAYKIQDKSKNKFLDMNLIIKNENFKRDLLFTNNIYELLQEFILARGESSLTSNINLEDFEKDLINENHKEFDTINETQKSKYITKSKKSQNHKFINKNQQSDINKKNFSAFEKQKKLEKSSSKYKMNLYRNAYCQICFLYYCPYHFKKNYKFYDYEFNNITLHKRYLERLIIEPQPRNGLENLQKYNIFKNNDSFKDIFDKLQNNNLLENSITKNNIPISEIEIENQENRNYNSHSEILQKNEKSNKFTIEKERKYSKIYKIDSISPKKINPNQNNFSRTKQIIQAYKLNINNYNPCSKHDGPCTNENCLCIKYRGACEKYCVCSGNCKNEYPGCSCYKRCESDCPCITNMRECDPDICRCCSNLKSKINSPLNDNDNLIDDEIKLNKFSKNKKNNLDKNKKNIKNENFYDCGNCSIFLGNIKKTCVSKSLIAANYGLFTMKDLKKNEFICEYIGELLSKEETDRRSVFNDQLGLNYFFKLNENFDIDAYAIGNEMRFVNHSSYGYDNCFARTKYVRGVYRIGLFALRDISKGEELFFDYKINWNVPWMNNYKKLFSLNQ